MKIKIIHHRLKQGNHTITQKTEKHLAKSSIHSQWKTLSKQEIKRNFIKLIKDIFEKPMVNIILNDERLKAFPLISGTRLDCLSHHFGKTLSNLASRIRQEEEIKGIRLERKEQNCICRQYDNLCGKFNGTYTYTQTQVTRTNNLV